MYLCYVESLRIKIEFLQILKADCAKDAVHGLGPNFFKKG